MVCIWKKKNFHYILSKIINFPSKDNVFDQHSTTESLYDAVVRPIVDQTLTGINGTVFAYGQTSSGKTYTMTGIPGEPGIMPLAIKQIFDYGETAERQFLFR